MILHIPHSSTYVPRTFKVLEGISLDNEFQRMTDWFTDELFDLDEAKKLVFPYSRLYCDVEGFREKGWIKEASMQDSINILKSLDDI